MRLLKSWVAVLLLAVGTACAAAETIPENAETSSAPPQVTGVITSIEPAEGTPTSFTVEEEDGDVYEIAIDPELDYGFSLDHLREHQDTKDPVDVLVKNEDGKLIAVSIADVD